MFLDRLSHLLAVRRACAELNSARLRALVAHAIYSTYQDLRELGAKDEADRMLDRCRG
jgi:hypothetical protein